VASPAVLETTAQEQVAVLEVTIDLFGVISTSIKRLSDPVPFAKLLLQPEVCKDED